MRVRPEDRGQGLVEYAFILVLVALVVIVAVMLFGTGVGDLFSTVVYGV
jgi:pilus assembly protein Flp/PilA